MYNTPWLCVYVGEYLHVWPSIPFRGTLKKPKCATRISCGLTSPHDWVLEDTAAKWSGTEIRGFNNKDQSFKVRRIKTLQMWLELFDPYRSKMWEQTGSRPTDTYRLIHALKRYMTLKRYAHTSYYCGSEGQSGALSKSWYLGTSCPLFTRIDVHW